MPMAQWSLLGPIANVYLREVGEEKHAKQRGQQDPPNDGHQWALSAMLTSTIQNQLRKCLQVERETAEVERETAECASNEGLFCQAEEHRHV